MPDTADRALSVLIVEDETVVALDLRERVLSMGHDVCGIADSAAKALALAIAERPGLILMDIMLKGDADGVDAATNIRAEYDVPVIFVTAYGDGDTFERIKAVSPYGYIVKPYNERELRIAIELGMAKRDSELALIEAKRAAEESDRAKTRFLSNLSHEFVTPINSMLGFLDLAMGIAREGELREYLGMVSASARRLESLLRSLLDYAKLESGVLAAIRSDFLIEELVLRCWEPFRVEAFGKGLGVRLYLDPKLPVLAYGDAAKITVIVRCLLENSLKFTQEGSIALYAERYGDALLFRIVDTGPGISADKRSLLFKDFTQLDDSITRSHGGLGLGLSLAKGLSRLLDATLAFEDSMDGRGTQIKLVVPDCLAKGTAYPDASFDPAGLSLALGDPEPHCAGELRRWAKDLSLELLPPGREDRANLLVVDAAGKSYEHPAVLELSSPIDPPEDRKERGVVFRRPYPLSLGVLLDALKSTAPLPRDGRGKNAYTRRML